MEIVKSDTFYVNFKVQLVDRFLGISFAKTWLI